MKPNEQGYYGEFGGAFIPELLHRNVQELQENYERIMLDESFISEYGELLRYYVGRPTPLYFAARLSKKYGTNVFLKREDLNHTGAHKINNAIGQVLLAKRLNKKHVIAETGAGQHGVATATACALLDLPCTVFMGKKDITRQQPNVLRMQMLGAKLVTVESGSQTLKDATNEAIRYWINHPNDTHYVIGSVVGPHPYPDMVARFQSIISTEVKNQLAEQTGNRLPTHVMACVGGGSNAAGIFYDFIGEESVQLVGAEAGGKGAATDKTAATLTTGRPGVLHGSLSYLMQDKDGQVVEPHSISAGLDYPGVGPMHSYLHTIKRAQYIAINDFEAMEAAFELVKLEGIIPAIETGHAFALLKKLRFKPNDRVVICLSGRGDKDMAKYESYRDVMVD
ncbi:MAG TPA: tryptophan synthase subunit beta [Flavobacteriales bacterium]|nr:tryptophan synthase subunit beta [Flavobacteriales bacterium]